MGQKIGTYADSEPKEEIEKGEQNSKAVLQLSPSHSHGRKQKYLEKKKYWDHQSDWVL
jgi:hypothetical protein